MTGEVAQASQVVCGGEVVDEGKGRRHAPRQGLIRGVAEERVEPDHATRERFPDVDDLRIGIPSELVREVPLIATTALVLVAHDYKYDVPVLRHALGTPVGYIGLLGSSRRGAAWAAAPGVNANHKKNPA